MVVKTKEQQEEKETISSQILSQIYDISKQMTDLDEYFDKLPTLQSKVDEEISDLLHYIENNQLNLKQSAKMIKLLQEKRLIRRGLSNDNIIKNTYNNHKNKLIINVQRPFFLNEINKKARELNSTYRNRQLSDENIKELLR